MMKVPILHRWTPAEVYQAYVRSLMDANPPTVEIIVKRGKAEPGKLGKIIRQKRITGGYWGKRNRTKDCPNFWIYTKVKNQIVEVINYDRWMKIMDTYFLKAREYIIAGFELQLGGRLGVIGARHIERNFAKPRIDYHATKQQPMVEGSDGKMRRKCIVYRTDDSYVRIGWRRACRIAGEKSYEFKPSGSNTNGNSFQQEFSRANIHNPELKLIYPFYPYLKQTANGV